MDRLFFLDIESNDAHPHSLSFLELCAIECDRDLKTVSELEIQFRLPDHQAISPHAMAVTNIDPEKVKYRPNLVDEYDGAVKAHDYFSSRSEDERRLFIGYNNISFDEEAIRALYFRNLLNPYISTEKNALRLDLLHMARCLHFIDPTALSTVLNNKGKPSFKLGDIARANGIDNEGAHRAMFDVEMTHSVFKFIQENSKGFVDRCIEYADKDNFKNFLDYNKGKIVWNFSQFGDPKVEACSIVSSKRDFSLINLEIDPKHWIHLSPFQLSKLLYTKHSPISTIAINKPNFVFANDDPLIQSAKQRNKKLSEAEYSQRCEVVNTNEVHKKITAAIAIRNKQFFNAKVGNITSEEKIYKGSFRLKKSDKDLIEAFHELYNENKLDTIRRNILEHISDDRLKDFACRLLIQKTKNTDELTKIELQAYQELIQRRLFTHEGISLLTIGECIEQLDDLKDSKFYDQYKAFLSEIKVNLEETLSNIEFSLQNKIKTEHTPETYHTPQQMSLL